MAHSPVTRVGSLLPPEWIVFGRSEAMRSVRANLERIACARVTVLIQGESGTGKGVIAQLIHENSPWANGPFLRVDCGGISGSGLEQDLFGRAAYGNGDFEGAAVDRHGTLFLDEITDLDAALQSKLVQLLRQEQVCRIRANGYGQVDVRIVCACRGRLDEAVASGKFRQDLYYRINVMTVHVPPLRQRSADIPNLVEYFVDAFSREYHCQARPISDSALELLIGHSWPGNIRELENLIKRYVLLGSEDAISSELQPKQAVYAEPELSAERPVSLKAITRATVREVEQRVILKILKENQWNRRRAARALNISYRALMYKLKGVNMPAAAARSAAPGER